MISLLEKTWKFDMSYLSNAFFILVEGNMTAEIWYSSSLLYHFKELLWALWNVFQRRNVLLWCLLRASTSASCFHLFLHKTWQHPFLLIVLFFLSDTCAAQLSNLSFSLRFFLSILWFQRVWIWYLCKSKAVFWSYQFEKLSTK